MLGGGGELLARHIYLKSSGVKRINVRSVSLPDLLKWAAWVGEAVPQGNI